MKKRLLAFMCVLAILAGMVVVPASAANASGEGYKVGYAKLDINPWVDLTIDKNGTKIGISANRLDEDGNPIPYTDAETNIVKTKIHNPVDLAGKPIEVEIVSLGMGGYGNSAERQVACMTDDNGDGYISYGDGIYVTCTAVTDSNKKTVLYLTLDLTGVSENVTDTLRNMIVERLNGAVTKDAIMINANHSHSSMNIVSAKEGTALKAYYEYMYERVAEAAAKAMADSAEATMSKGSIESSVGMNALGYGEVVMNRVRHTKTKGHLEIRGSNGFQDYTEGGNTYYTEPLILTSHSGDGPVWRDAPNGTRYKFQIETTGNQVSQVDETLHVLKFDRGDEKNPVVMINWRGHSTLNGGGSANKNLSSDYANSLRYRLENNSQFTKNGQDYCVAFWQGASGNVNSGDSKNGQWKTATSKSDDVDAEVKVVRATMDNDAAKVIVDGEDPYDFYDQYYNAFTDAYNDNRFFYGARYGYLLAKIALVCMKDYMKECDTGAIRTKQVIYQATRQQFSYGEYLAARAWDDAMKNNDNKETIKFPYCYDVDTDGDGVLERYILNSSFHAKSVLADYPKIEPDKVKDGENLIPVEMQTKEPIEINAIMMGENVAIVTLPGEPFERYSLDAKLDDTTDNDWDDLIDWSTYGEPFVLGYSNGRAGYLPNALAYDYLSHLRMTLGELYPELNTEELRTAAFESVDNYKKFYNVFAAGSYESNTANVMRGTGEALVAKLDKMLETMDDPAFQAPCEACNNAIVGWKPLNNDTIMAGIYESGHYYLEEDLITHNAPVKIINGDMKVCLDLKGKTYTNNGRIFELSGNGELNIMDSGDGGTLTAKSGSLKGVDERNIGGMVHMIDSSHLNIYGGKLEFIRDRDYLDYLEALDQSTYEISGGGVINAKGTSQIYLYDGEIRGGEMAKNNGTTFTGATIRMVGNVQLHVSGGQIVRGILANDTRAAGECVYAASGVKVYIEDSGSIDELYLTGKKLTVTGPYTGTTNVIYASMELGDGLTVGTVSKITQLTPGTLNCLNEDYQFDVNGKNLCLRQMDNTDCEAAIGGIYNGDLQNVVNYVENDLMTEPESNVIKLFKDVTSVTISKEVYLDLNGCDIGTVNVDEGATLYCLDSANDDYDDNKCGKIVNVTGYGTVAGVEAGMIPWNDEQKYPDGSLDSYLMVEEGENKNLSFHRVNLQITAMTLDADNENGPSVYYKADFQGDDSVKANVANFGVALSVQGVPNATNMGLSSKYSSFESEDFGNDKANTSTLLQGIMKESNADLTNRVNSNIRVYGRAYIRTSNGQYIFGVCKDRTLQEQTQAANSRFTGYDQSEQKALTNMYRTYFKVMKDWNLQDIVDNYKEEEEKVLKVLTLGHSLGNDTNHMLNLVAAAEGTGRYDELVIGALYYSGCPLERHVKNLYTNTPEYSFRVTTNKNTRVGLEHDDNVTPVKTIAGAIDYDYWDIIIMQDGVFQIADAACYTNGNRQTLENYIAKNAKNKDVRLAWNMTWAPPLDPELSATNDNAYADSYKRYNSDRKTMYNAIVANVQKHIVNDDKIEFVIPSATIFQNALESGLTEKEIHRDYVHANDRARLMVAYGLYCMIMDIDHLDTINVNMVPKSFSIRNKWDPNWMAKQWDLTDEEKEQILGIVNSALDKPYQITDYRVTNPQ